MSPIVDVVIPALNEEGAIGHVLKDIDRRLVRHVIVVDNGSTDRTAQVAAKAGALVLHESCRGYGSACQRGLAFLKEQEIPPDIVVFLDGDYSDFPEEIFKLIQPILLEEADFVVGSRVLGQAADGSLTPQQVWGNRLACWLLKRIYGLPATDLGPFRAIRWDRLQQLAMRDKNYGWTVEMQLKAARHGLRYREVAVRYRQRIGKSKVSGTLRGTVLAGYKILLTVFKYSV